MNNNQDAKHKIPDPPRGIKAIPWRLPIWIYRLHLGWLLGHRMLLLTHKGRVSGKERTAVLEVIKYEKSTNTHFVASGFGEKSDWFQNISKTPDVTIQVASTKIPAHAACLTSDEAKNVFLEYNQKHPHAIKNLAKLVGYDIGSTQEEMLAFLALIPVVAFHPKT
jgi:deazaflavin-dependent oxidoreductase (nitroreductase family)